MASKLLTRHTARIYLEETGTDSRGNTVQRPTADPVTIACTITPRLTATDRSGTDAPRWSLLAPTDTPLGRWSRVHALGRDYAVVSWPRSVGLEGSQVEHIAAELVEQR